YTLTRFLVFAGGYDTANGRPNAVIQFDEIRVGDTYADVTPIVGATPPNVVSSNQTAATLINTPLNLTLGASDADGDPLTFYIGSNPTYGSLGAVNSNSVTYTPNADYVGPDTFTFYATDGVHT